MEKHNWNTGLGMDLISAYDKVRKLARWELQQLAVRMVYPEKFWKTANSYYHSNKAWIPEKSVEKLQTAVLQTEEKIRFIQKIFTFSL